jgi:hypothetical protein
VIKTFVSCTEYHNILFISGDKTTPAIDKTDTVVPVTDCIIAAPKKTSKTRKAQRSRKKLFEENDSSMFMYRGNPNLNTNSD